MAEVTTDSSTTESWLPEPMGRVAAPVREQVVAALREAILEFRLPPGQRLVERELVSKLGVSRTTVREALRELTSEGLVTMVPQRGVIVSKPTLEEAQDLYEIRASLESLVVKRFVERASDEEIIALRIAVEDFALAVEEAPDVRTILAKKDGFYAVLIPGARSLALQQMIGGIQARVQMLRATSLSQSDRPTEVVRELRAITSAIERRNADLAAELCAAHIHKAMDTALIALDDPALAAQSH